MKKSNKLIISQHFPVIKISLLLCVFLLSFKIIRAQNQIIGTESYIHLEKVNNVWWFVNSDGEKFVSTGMNHIDKKIRFAEYNKDYWVDQFGENIFIDDNFNFQATEEIKKWMQQIVKDHKDYGFNTIAFHRPKYLPDEYFNELEIYFLAKIKTGDIHAGRVKRSGAEFPDVFSDEFKSHAEKVAEKYCSKHRSSKYLIGYTYDDLPSYSFEEYNRKIRYEGHKGGLVFHPWVNDIINDKGLSNGKAIWISILKQHYKTPAAVAENYMLPINSWKDLEEVTDWKKAKGLPVEDHHAVGEEYYTYLKGISNLPFMLGWHNCGYLEQWKGSKPDATGKEQTGFFLFCARRRRYFC